MFQNNKASDQFTEIIINFVVVQQHDVNDVTSSNQSHQLTVFSNGTVKKQTLTTKQKPMLIIRAVRRTLC